VGESRVMSHRKTNATAPVLDSTRLFALSAAITLNIRLMGLPDSSDSIRQDGLQGQVLAITTQHSWIFFSQNSTAMSPPSIC
jgi:hypothetical protein